ncbi:MAG: hypothetical protein A2808_01155 [Candidatus Moranbacteria bacterium RIFCSPHIGHO2_01_FULL_55_24]|nr:MAG: hypothetical protein A2808_01155 [Candidatus Moranbacteria bacterium RIFCSPHIGHO2_01_FULL_55_24]
MKKNLWFLVKVAVTLVLIAWLLEHVDWNVVLHELQNLSWKYMFLYVVFQLIGTSLSVKKWQVIARFKNLHFSFREGFFTYLTGAFINNFLPSTIGGDTYRSLWLSKRSDSRAKAFSTVVFDRFLGLWTTALLAFLGVFFLLPYLKESLPLQLTLGALLVFILADAVLVYAYCQSWFQRLIALIPWQKLRNLIQEIILYTDKGIWSRGVFWSALFIFVGIGLSNYMLFLAMGNPLPFGPFLGLVFLIAIVSSVPLSINNIGIKEWAYVAFFGLLGISLETAVTAALLSRFLQMFISFLALPQYIAGRRDKSLI